MDESIAYAGFLIARFFKQLVELVRISGHHIYNDFIRRFFSAIRLFSFLQLFEKV